MKPLALITGATSGIGKATAKLLGQNGFRLVIAGRRQDRLLALQAELLAHTEVAVLCFDVRDQVAMKEQLASLPPDFTAVDLLINNAGNAHGLASFQDGAVEDWEAMIDINVKGLLYLTKALLPNMIDRKKGHIINIGSIAGKEVYPNGNVYCASKYAVDAISTGMRLDLNQHGIKVSQIAPGLVETEFSLVRFKGDNEKAERVYEGYDALQPEDLADLILFMATRPLHVNLADVLILPTAQASASIVKKS